MEDAMLVPKQSVMVGAFYAHDSWTRYWEGTLERDNGNIGTLTTQSAMAVVGYGVTSKLTVIASVPYVWTHASQGVLQDMSGVQDITVAAKYRLFASDPDEKGFSAFAVAAAAFPATDYTPDFLPLSIGSGGSRASGRLTLGYEARRPWFGFASAAYTFCNNVKLDRSSYYTNGQLFLTNEVAMPNVMDYTVAGGFRGGRLRLPVSLVQRQTLGGGDIRRQDMPFVSNRMNFTRVGAEAAYGLTSSGDVSVHVGASRVIAGRNVGKSTTLTTGMAYALHF
jgi:hypothetical protein